MREIKYRAWDKKENEFIYAEPIFGFFPSIGANEENTMAFNDRYAIQEFTGLFDKAGKEIYEGDIVRTEHPQIREWSDTNPEIRIIGWDDIEAKFAFYKTNKEKQGSGWCFTKNIFLGSVIIGNIFENKELVGK